MNQKEKKNNDVNHIKKNRENKEVFDNKGYSYQDLLPELNI